MDQAQTIALYQPTLRAVAFRILKSKADAEDVVQETFLKWLNTEQATIQNTKAYLIKAVTNNCINHLNTLKNKKEQYFDSINWYDLLERFKETDFSYMDLEAELVKAFRVLQQKLEPLERAVYLLKEVFDFDYESLQQMLNKKQENCRQLFSRAKKKLEKEETKTNHKFPTRGLIDTFKNACDFGTLGDLINELKEDIALAINKPSSLTLTH